LGVTIENVLSLLRPGGVLILYEVTDPPAWIDTSVALIAGWTKSADGLRDNGPLLSKDTWRTLLIGKGFTDVVVAPETSSSANVLGMSVMIARAPLVDVGELQQASEPATLARRPTVSAAAGPSDADAVLARLEAALPYERLDILVAYVREHIAAVLRRDEAIGRRKNLMELGIDSLMAIELRDRLARGLALAKPLPASLIFDYPNIDAIAGHVASSLGLAVDESVAGSVDVPVTSDDRARRQANVESLSDDEIAALLLKKLERDR
jgi:hypothetical protein